MECNSNDTQLRRKLAMAALDAWARYADRAPIYMPSPDDFSKPYGSSEEYDDPDQPDWRFVEDELVRWGAGGRLGQSHPLRKLLRWVHEEDGLPPSLKTPERFLWPLPGLTKAEIEYLLGMPAPMRARGDYEEFLARIERRLVAKAEVRAA